MSRTIARLFSTVITPIRVAAFCAQFCALTKEIITIFNNIPREKERGEGEEERKTKAQRR